MNGRLFMEAMGDIKDDFIMEAADLDEIRKSFSEWDDEEDDVTTEPEKTGHKKIKRIHRIRKLLIAAVISVSLLLAANFVAMAMGYDSLAILKEFGDRIIEMFEGEKVDFKGHDIIKTGRNVSYSSIDEFFEKTDFDILYPSVLPDTAKIKFIKIDGSYDSNFNYTTDYQRIFYVTDKTSISIIANANPEWNKAFLTDPNNEIKTIGKYKCYISLSDYTIQTYFIYDGIVYSILTPTYDDIVTIVSNMKEYEE